MTWLRSDLTAVGLGRGLVIRDPRIALTRWSDGTYTLTGADRVTRPGMRLVHVLDWCSEWSVPKPTDADLAWLEGR